MTKILTQTTHQRLLVDSIGLVQTESGRRLASVLLRHHRHLLRGSRDPDRRFRDFHNHVIHVTDGYWGGAPRLAHRWYDHMVDMAVQRRYRSAAYAAGVMAHYVADPMHPLHTAQCDRSRLMHLPAEYIGTVCYQHFRQCWVDQGDDIAIQLSNSPAWLGELILHAASRNHRHYLTLVHDIHLSDIIEKPSKSFGSRFESAHAEIIGVVLRALASIFDRAGQQIEDQADRRIHRPSAIVTNATLLACAPPRWFANRWGRQRLDHRVRRYLARIEDRTMTVDDLPTEVDIVRRVINIHHAERRRRQQRHLVKHPMIAGRVGLFAIEPKFEPELELNDDQWDGDERRRNIDRAA